MITALTNATVYTGREKLADKVVLLEGGIISGIVNHQEVPADSTIIDLEGAVLAPGFIDLQIYGAGAEIFSASLTPENLAIMENTLLRQGCTGFYTTIATNSPEVVEKGIEVSKLYRKRAKGNFLGLHLEGPYLNPKKRGAHIQEFIKPGTIEEMARWIELAEGEIKMMTIAPELQSEEFIQYLCDQHIVISAGHTEASYEEGIKHFDVIQAATHLYNAMLPMHHRTPGLIPAIFLKKPYTSIIADGLHVSFPMLKMAKETLGDKLFLITDAVTETHSGPYQHVAAENYFSMPDGTLSGSSLSMIKAVENCVKFAGISLDEALRMSSTYPAKLIGLDKSVGEIAPGITANLVAFDQNFQIKRVWLNSR